jgi:hypothetical protein
MSGTDPVHPKLRRFSARLPLIAVGAYLIVFTAPVVFCAINYLINLASSRDVIMVQKGMRPREFRDLWEVHLG